MSRRAGPARRATRFLKSILRAPTSAARNAHRAVRAHPLRAIAILAIWLSLTSLVLTSTLPIALATVAPELALLLNANDPNALMVKANQIRSNAFAKAGTEEKADNRSEAWRAEVEDITRRVIEVDPLNASAYTLLGDAATDPRRRRDLMSEAMKRSRRQSEATFELMRRSAQVGEFGALINFADIILRTRPDQQSAVLTTLALLSENPDAQPDLIQWIIRSPSARTAFFRQLNTVVTHADAPAQLMQKLTELGHPPNIDEINQYVSAIITWKFPEYAYNVWLQSLPEETLGTVGLLNDAHFGQDPGRGPFDWHMSTGRNAIGDFVAIPSVAYGRVFHVTFGVGRVQFPEISQTLVLAPGRYELGNGLQGSIIGKRGLHWEVNCLYGKRVVLGRSEPLLGQFAGWTENKFEFDVPETPDCAGQVLRLYHDARSPSEQLVRGEVWLGGLTLRFLSDRG